MPTHHYQPLSETSLLQEGKSLENQEGLVLRAPHQRSFWVGQAIFFLVSLSMLVLALSRDAVRQPGCYDYMPQWSPALEAVEGTGHLRRFDPSFFAQNEYKGPPSPALDAMWDGITHQSGGMVSLSEESMLKINASTESAVKLPPEVGGGGYLASVEALHQLHCLNQIRKVTYWDYYHHDKPFSFNAMSTVFRNHLDHCIDNLRQKLMCDADPGIYVHVWIDGYSTPYPDFRVQHKCRSFDALESWVEKNQLYRTEADEIVRPAGSKALDHAP